MRTLFLFALLLVLGCKPKEDSPAKETVPLSQTIDSLTTAEQDGTETNVVE